MSNDSVTKAVVGVARRNMGGGQKPIVLSTGYTAIIRPVSMAVIMDAESSIPDPEVPTWYNEDKDKHEPNPDHPDYVKALEDASMQRQLAIADAMIMYGVDMVDDDGNPVHSPSDDDWVKKMRFMHKRGLSKLNPDDFDLDEDMERDFLFKKYFVVGTPDIPMLVEKSGALNEEEVQEAVKSFQDNQA